MSRCLKSKRQKINFSLWHYRFTKTESSVILLMEAKNTCQVGCGLYNVLVTKRNRTWQCFSIVGTFITGPIGTSPRAGNSWYGTTKNTPNLLMCQRWWKPGSLKVWISISVISLIFYLTDYLTGSLLSIFLLSFLFPSCPACLPA